MQCGVGWGLRALAKSRRSFERGFESEVFLDGEMKMTWPFSVFIVEIFNYLNL
jgi:hypothetical protein